MTKTTAAIRAFIDAHNSDSLTFPELERSINAICSSASLKNLLTFLVNCDAFSHELGQEFASAEAIEGLSACRRLRSCLNLSLSSFFGLLAELTSAFNAPIGADWSAFASKIQTSELGKDKLLTHLLQGEEAEFYEAFAAELVEVNPHAIYPTSSYREGYGHVVSTPDDSHVEAVMGSTTFTTIKVLENSLDPEQLTLKKIYAPLGRCVCLIDRNVDRYFGDQLEEYFNHHGIPLEKLVYRAMEVDKGINTVERMLGDFKRLGVSRNEPVLIMGGGVLADTGGLACALYHRNTPYVMLSTSLVSGIDAGPSPRTCCDGFGYKNLFGAYHTPVLAIADLTFFRTLREGWLRHGISEIIKMAVVKDAELFAMLEQAGPSLLETRFGTVDCEPEAEIRPLSQRIIGAALRCYVEAEYGNLYETHQCRPHAYGHTWSPGFEIESGLLHGHAVSIGMGFGAFLSYRKNWITEAEFERIMKLMSTFGLSLWNDVMLKTDTVWAAQEKIVQKRGGNLAAPLPKGEIGKCGYLNSLTRGELAEAIAAYRQICEGYPRQGRGLDPLCSDVGLEDPSTVFQADPDNEPALAFSESLSEV